MTENKIIDLKQRELVCSVSGYVHDGETFCWKHLPDKPTDDHTRVSEFIGFGVLRGESDTFRRCQVCLQPLDCSLTEDGVRYEFEQIEQSLRVDDWSLWDKPCKHFDGTFYDGSPSILPSRETASLLLDYTLTDLQRRVLEAFLHVSKTT